MEEKKNSKLNILKKLLTLVPRVLYNILIILCVILIAIIVMQRITNSNNSVAGYRIFKIVSGSMVPKYDVGEVVICKETDVNKIKIGDAIVYRGKNGALKNKLVMHEVVEIHYNENGDIDFYAKGLKNNQEDPQVKPDQILGVVKHKSTILTWLYALATSIYSSFVIILILVINVFVSFRTTSKPNKKIKELSAKNEDAEVEQNKKYKTSENEIEKDVNINNQNENNIQENKSENIEKDLKESKAIETEKNTNFVKKSQPVQFEEKQIIQEKSAEKQEENVIDRNEKFDKIETVEVVEKAKKVEKITKKTRKNTKDGES